MQFFMEEILEDERVIREIQKHSELNKKAKEIADYIVKMHHYPKMEQGLLPLFVLGYLADDALASNLNLGISREISIHTFKDVNIWLQNYEDRYGKIGLAEFDWLILHYTSRLFRLGRLQFQLVPADSHIPSGDFMIEVHIPQGEPLDVDECRRSFKMAIAFFEKYYPEYKADYFMCHSWLLNPALSKLLCEESNIVRFMRLWEPYDAPGDDSAQAIERVFGFGFGRKQLESAPENTGLQRALKEYLLAENALELTAGYMPIYEKV